MGNAPDAVRTPRYRTAPVAVSIKRRPARPVAKPVICSALPTILTRATAGLLTATVKAAAALRLKLSGNRDTPYEIVT